MSAAQFIILGTIQKEVTVLQAAGNKCVEQLHCSVMIDRAAYQAYLTHLAIYRTDCPLHLSFHA